MEQKLCRTFSDRNHYLVFEYFIEKTRNDLNPRVSHEVPWPVAPSVSLADPVEAY